MTPVPTDPFGAWVPGPRAERAPTGSGPLSGLRFAVKDLFDVAGVVTSYGNPDWARTHPAAVSTAPLVQSLLAAGAELVGKTKTVELAFGLTGENVWHGTPINPAAPDRFPGGSSCGSAAAVAGNLVDFALGSDTGGSVRIPASYCGLFGIRPSGGALSLAGARPLAPSLDVAGWFSRSAGLLRRVGETLLPGGGDGACGPLLRVEDAWTGTEPATATALHPALTRLEQRFGQALPVRLVPEGLAALYAAYRAVQAAEAWASLGDWIAATDPRFGPGVGERFAAARAVGAVEAEAGRALRRVMQDRLRPLLAGGAVLIYPTSPCPAPRLSATTEEQGRVREATIGLTAIGGMAGLPEVTLPAGQADGAPVGLSLVAGVGRDHALLRFVVDAAAALALAV